MHFHINGKFLANICWENEAWTVSASETDKRPGKDDVDLFASLDRNDIGAYMEALFLGCAAPGSDQPAGQRPIDTPAPTPEPRPQLLQLPKNDVDTPPCPEPLRAASSTTQFRH